MFTMVGEQNTELYNYCNLRPILQKLQLWFVPIMINIAYSKIIAWEIAMTCDLQDPDSFQLYVSELILNLIAWG